ncbi:MAG: hypothetical protein WKG00_34625 [Polyangiaceae bacterium]
MLTWPTHEDFVEVLGVANLGLDPAVDARLRAALRQLDPEERERERQLETRLNAEAHARNAEAQKEEASSAATHRAASANADVDRPMEVHFRYDRDLEIADPADLRPITAEARAAVLEWVHERDQWVKGRGQVVGDAKITVWPGPLPASAGGERVKAGTFLPVTAPAAKTDPAS